jgi:hypothetical protein
MENKKHTSILKCAFLAAGEGFEPSQTESESGVLPLHKPAKDKAYYTRQFKFVKHVFPKWNDVFP